MQTHYRLDALLISALLYINYDKLKNIGWIFYPSILMSILAVVLHSQLDFKYAGINYFLISMSFSFFVISLINRESKIKKFLSFKWIKHIGLVSYEIYLTHEIVIGVGVRLGLKNYPLLYLIYSILFSVFCAHVFYSYISNPINLFLRKKFIN